MRHIRTAVVGVMCYAAAVLADKALVACTAFCAVGAGQVLVGNNEDWDNPRTKIRFVPASAGSFGRVYVGFDDLRPQGGMNERGLWFDGFSAPAISDKGSSDLPHFSGEIVDTAMAQCSTVEEVVRLFSQYNRAFLAEGILMFADASGDAVSIERNVMVRKSGNHFVQTNFHQSLFKTGPGDGRFKVASEMLESAGEGISIDLFRRILAATHQKGASPTLYSNIYELKSRTMHLYHFQDFEHVVTFRLADELKKGERVLDIPALFPRNAAAEAFAARHQEASRAPARSMTIAMFAIPGILIVLAVFGWVRGGRQFRIALTALVGVIALVAAAIGVTLNTQREASSGWMQFSIGPASGRNAWINNQLLRGNGVTLRAALATAYDIPPIRIVGPAWLTDTRYSINAVVGIDEADSFRPLLQRELQSRLGLETHFEVRPFDIFVLTATGGPRLERALGQSPAIRVSDSGVRCRETSMELLAATLQNILGKPVVDETGITGSYNLEFEWGEDRVASVTTTLRDRFGLQLSPGKRDMQVLIVDNVRRDASMVLLAHVGRLTRAAPPYLRQQIADALTIR